MAYYREYTNGIQISLVLLQIGLLLSRVAGLCFKLLYLSHQYYPLVAASYARQNLKLIQYLVPGLF
jgi:hypothetical protein